MGVVFRAWQLGTDREVALKVMSPHLTGDDAYTALFKREARTAASVHHPHVIDVYDFGEVDGLLYLAMRLVQGRDLSKILAAEGALDPSRTAAIVAQAAHALHAAHGRGLVHRDVKPANLLVTTRAGLEHVYLTDFGLTKHQRGTALAATRGMVGTLAYMAPEQARDDPVDARTDVYSLGAVVYHIVTGELPYPREVAAAQLYAHMFEPAPRPRDVVPELPEALDEVIARAMAKDPADRFSSALELGRATQAALRGQAAGDSPAITRPTSDRLAGREWREVALSEWAGQVLPPGSRIAGYRVDGLAGVGAMGHVYRATHLGLDRTVALKLVRPELGEDAGFRERFKREAKRAAKIDHPNVVQVYAADEADGVLFLAMRYVDGPSLDETVREEGPLDPRRAAKIIVQVAGALDAAHAHGVIHRDPKSGNVLTEGEPGHERAYLSDFGLSYDPVEEPITTTGEFVGSFDYLSPEVIKGEGSSPASDIYVLGCVLYECLTGHHPYSNRESEAHVLYAHMCEAPPSVRDTVRSVPEALDHVVQRAMAKEPEARFPSAGSLGRSAVAAAGA
jgi:serine/threonine protein kinase